MASLLPPGMAAALPTDLTGINMSAHDSIVPTIVKVNVAFIAVVATTVLMRLFVRLALVRALGLDDILMLLAGVFAIIFSSMALAGIHWGFGRHIWDLDLFKVFELAKKDVQLLYVCQIMYATALAMTKCSIIASYLRIFPNPMFRRAMYVNGIIVVAVWICSIFVTIFQCAPIQGAWDFQLTHKKCVNILHFFYVMAAFNIAADLVLCTVPLPLFWKLNLPTKERVIVCVLFAFGFFATVASVLRLSQLHNLLGVDISYVCISSLNWSTVELGTGIVCASIPSMKALITRILPGRIFSIARSTHRTGHTSIAPSTPGIYDMKHMSLPASRGNRSMVDSYNQSAVSLALPGKSEYTTRVYAGSGGSDEETLFPSSPGVDTLKRKESSGSTRHGGVNIRTDVEVENGLIGHARTTDDEE